MPFLPELDEASKTVLLTLQRLGVATGRQLMGEAPISADELVKAVRKLMASGLIKASGNFSNPDEIGQAYFNIQPSAAGLADIVLSS